MDETGFYAFRIRLSRSEPIKRFMVNPRVKCRSLDLSDGGVVCMHLS